MKDPEKQDSFVLKLSGKAELPKALSIGHNIKTTLEGSIVSETIEDNDDGTHTHLYKFQPVYVETLTEKGERLRAKDTRSRSQQLRSLFFRKWREANEPISFDDYYNQQMLRLLEQEY